MDPLPSPSAREFQLERWCVLAVPLVSVFTWFGESNSNGYAVSEYFLTYRHGFLKRALVGEALSHLGFLSATRIHLVELAGVLLALAVSYVALWPLLSSTWPRRLLAVLFLCSPACIPHFSTLAAQPDVILYILLMLSWICLVRLPGKWGPIAALVPCAIALLVHESFPLLFYPALFAILVDGWRTRRFPLASILIHLAGFGAIFLAVLHFGQAHVSPDILFREAQARTNLALTPEVFEVLARGFAGQWKALLLDYTPKFIGGVVLSIVLLLPVLAGHFRLTLRVNRLGKCPLPRFAVGALFLFPMVLCFLGHDVLRWLAGADIGILLFALYRAMTEPEETSAAVEVLARPAWVGLLLLNIAMGPMGGSIIRFVAHLATLSANA